MCEFCNRKVPIMKAHPPTILSFMGVKTFEVGVFVRVILSSHNIIRLTPCFPRFVFDVFD